MSPQETKFLHGLVEELSKHMYNLGYAEGKAGMKPKADFKLSLSSKMILKTACDKHVKNR